MRTLLLFVPSTLVVLGLFGHAWLYRGRRTAIAFFASCLVFGILRGNIIHWITVSHYGGLMPYVFANPVVEIYHASVQACVGWVFSVYVSWWLAERVLLRIPEARGQVFPTVALACLGMASLSYTTESAAGAAGWWTWSIPVENPYFVGVPFSGIIAWFSVGFDFLMPFLLIVLSEHRGRPWTWATGLLLFAHMFAHVFGFGMGAYFPTQPYVAWHWLMFVAVLGLAFTARTRMAVPDPDPAARGLRSPKVLDGMMYGALGVYLTVMGVAYLGIGKDPGLLVAVVPLGLMILLAIPRVPLAAVLFAVLWVWVGQSLVFSAVLVPALFFWLLRDREAVAGPGWRRAAFFATLGLATVWGYAYVLEQGERMSAYVTHRLKAHRLAGKGEEEAASRERALAEAVRPGDIESFIQVGYQFQAMGEPDLAEAVFRACVRANPKFFVGYYDLGLIYSQTGRYGEAIAAFERALEIAPRFVQGHLGLGNVYLQKQEPERALGAFLRAAEIGSGLPEPENNAGIAYQALGRPEEAEAAFRRAVGIDEGFADGWANLGNAALIRGSPEEAAQFYRTALEADPAHARARQGLGMASRILKARTGQE